MKMLLSVTLIPPENSIYKSDDAFNELEQDFPKLSENYNSSEGNRYRITG